MRLIKYWIGRYRLRSGFCPQCNSSPPREDCPICRGSRDYGPRTGELGLAVWRHRWDNINRRRR